MSAETEGVRLAARFSLATNRLKFCGPADAEPTLYRAITGGEGIEEAKVALSRFEALYPYLEAIGARHGLSPFDLEVVEAYWIGNRLLDDMDQDDFVQVLRRLAQRGLPPFLARELQSRLPERPIPHHVFHVAFVGVGSVTGHVETTLPNMESCRPARARIRSVEEADRRIVVDRPSLELRGSRFVVGASRASTVPFDPAVLPDCRPGQEVVLHWDWPALQLDERQAENLSAYTERSLRCAAEAAPPAHDKRPGR